MMVDRSRHFPNLFVVGAPKCGTTSVCHYLSQHPDVDFCAQKEPGYLADDLEFRRPVTAWEDYHNLFKHEKSIKYRAEGTVTYLYSEAALSAIAARASNPKIVIMVRNPLSFMESLFTHNTTRGQEDADTLEQALELEVSRRVGENIPSMCHSACLLQYSRLATYSDYISEYINTLGSNNVFVGVFEDLVKDPHLFYKKLANFLGIPFKDDLKFPNLNTGRVIKSKKVQGLLLQPKGILRTKINRLMPAVFRKRLFWLLWDLNLKKGKSKIIDKNLQSLLKQKALLEAQKLEEWTDCDLKKVWFSN